jgi:hypothetical protein
MSGAAHCKVYEEFQAVKNLKVGITYDKKVNLMIFAGEDLPLRGNRIEKLFFWREITKLMNYRKNSQNGIDLNT